MTKKAQIPISFNWAEAEAQIIDEINLGVPNTAGCKDHVKLLAKEIIGAWKSPYGMNLKHFAKKKELEKLRDLRKKARELKAIWADLDPEIQGSLKDAVSPERFKGQTGISSAMEWELLGFINFGPEMLDRMIPAAEKVIKDGIAIGRRNYPEIRLVNQCAQVWLWRTGKKPKSARNRPFILFVTGVFHAIGLDPETVSVENTVRSWASIVVD